MRFHERILPILMAVFLMLPACAGASGTWYCFDEEHVPEQLGYRVGGYTGSVTCTFLGDCTLGTTEKGKGSGHSITRTIRQHGYAYPMSELLELTAGDDITIANLEGVLTDRQLEKVEKTFNFSGPSAYAAILTEGSVECVSLANNHSYDYGAEGLLDTKSALKQSAVSWFDETHMCVWESDEGLMIGFVGVAFQLTGKRSTEFARQVRILQDLGCSAVVVVMHAGEEYESTPTQAQKSIARQAAELGATLVIGHHPHIIQGYDLLGTMPVVYSLGNCVFGGNIRPKDRDALTVQVDMRFAESELEAMELRFYPILFTGRGDYNTYRPVFKSDTGAENALKKMEASTGMALEVPEGKSYGVLKIGPENTMSTE